MSPISMITNEARQVSFAGGMGEMFSKSQEASSGMTSNAAGMNSFSQIHDAAPETESFKIPATSFAERNNYQPSTFGHLMQQMVTDVNSQQVTAGEKVRDVLAGGPTPVHEAMIAAEEAGLSFRMLAEMRNKLLEGYQEIMRMQI